MSPIVAANWIFVTEWVTLGAVLLTVVLLIAYDVFVYIKSGGNATISTMVYTRSKKYPVIAFLVGFFLGFICGHLFWQTW
jgi:hypothetical protein